MAGLQEIAARLQSAPVATFHVTLIRCVARRPTLTQVLGLALTQQADISAIRFESDAARAAGFAGFNVVIFRDCVRAPDYVKILGPTKKPLEQWP